MKEATSHRSPPSVSQALPWNPLNCRLSLVFRQVFTLVSPCAARPSLASPAFPGRARERERNDTIWFQGSASETTESPAQPAVPTSVRSGFAIRSKAEPREQYIPWQSQGTKSNFGVIRRAEHHGTVLICVLACLAIVTATIAMTAQSALRIRNEARTQRQLLQTQFLCEAGVLRAKQQLQELDSYAGEEWCPNLSPTSFEKAFITIQVEPTDLESTRMVQVVAKLADKASSVKFIQQTHQFKIALVDSIPKETK